MIEITNNEKIVLTDRCALLTYRDDLVISAGSNAGALLVDGLGDGVMLEALDQDFEFLRDTSFNLLQGCRMRNTKTVCNWFCKNGSIFKQDLQEFNFILRKFLFQEYVSCPSCGRTLFDLQEISAQIREKTSHLPGVSVNNQIPLSFVDILTDYFE